MAGSGGKWDYTNGTWIYPPKVYLFDQSGKLLWSYKTDSSVWSVAISSDGKYVVAGSGGKIYFFDNYVFITLAEQTINKAKSMGLSPIKAESLLSQAKQEFSEGNYNESIKLAKRSYELAIDVDQDGIPNNKDFAPTIPNNYIYFGVSTAIVLSSISAYGVRRRRKRRREYEMKKQRLIGEMENILRK